MPHEDDAIEPESLSLPSADGIRERLAKITADLDLLGEALVAAHVQTALDALDQA